MKCEKCEKCEKCGGDLFKIESLSDCSECESNGIWDDEDQKYVYKGEGDRTEADDGGECERGRSYNFGCYLYTCAKCEHSTNLPMVEC